MSPERIENDDDINDLLHGSAHDRLEFTRGKNNHERYTQTDSYPYALTSNPEGTPGYGMDVYDLTETIFHDNDISRFACCRRSFGPKCDPDIRRYQHRRIIDAITDECDRWFSDSFYGTKLIDWQCLRNDILFWNPNLLGYSHGDRFVVASDKIGVFDTVLAQILDGRFGVSSKFISKKDTPINSSSEASNVLV